MAKTATKKKTNSSAKQKKPNSVSVMHHGKRVFGIVAKNILAKRAERAKARNGNQAKKANTKAAKKKAPKKKSNLDHRDAKHTIHTTDYWRGDSRGESAWHRAERQGQQRLFDLGHVPGRKGNPKISPYSQAGRNLFNRIFDVGINPKRRNSGGVDKAIDDFVEFQGREPSETLELVTPDGTPKHTSVCGPIPRIELMDGRKLDFHKSAGAQPILLRRGNKLYIASEGFLWSQPGPIGLVKKIHYITAKDHINSGELIQYHHRFGEEGGDPPTLIADHDRMFKLEGGSYEITGDGILD